jgi:hypothetical protein
MKAVRPAVVAALLAPFFLPVGFSRAQEAPNARIVWWSGEYEAAIAEAKARNVPLVFVFIQDGEEANERIVSGVFSDNEYVAAMKRAVPVVLSHEGHALKKETVDGEVKGVCSKFGGTTCEAHRRLEPYARADFVGPSVKTPLHVFVLPDRTVFDQMVDVAPPGAYVDTLKKAQAKLGRGVGRAEYLAAKGAVAEARRLVTAKDYVGAVKSARAAYEGVKGTSFGKDLEAVLVSVERAAAGRIEEALAAEKAGDAYRALKLLETGTKQFAGADAIAAMKKELERIKASKAGRAAATLLAREDRAQPSWTAAEKAVEERDFLRAKREFERVAKVAVDTPLAAAAEKRLAALAADPDLKALFDKASRESSAEAALRTAESLHRDGEKAKAKAAFENVLKAYPGTKAAEAAKKRLESP